MKDIILRELHHEHPGIIRMKALSRIHIWYPNIDGDIESIVKGCVECEKVSNEPAKSIIHPWQWPVKPMDRIHIDYFEYNNSNFLLMVDSHSKWLEVEEIKKCDSYRTISCLRKWFSRYGLPKQLISDNGPQFISREYKDFMEQCGINHLQTAAYHQSSNGQAERFVQTINKGLKLNDASLGDVQKKLDNYLFAYRITPSCVTRKSPAELFLGRKIKSRLDLIKPSLESLGKNFIEPDYNTPREFSKGDQVFARKYNSSEKWNKRLGNKIYEVLVNEKIFKRH